MRHATSVRWIALLGGCCGPTRASCLPARPRNQSPISTAASASTCTCPRRSAAATINMRGRSPSTSSATSPAIPSIVVQNMVGAEGIKAANYIFTVAPQDGTAIGALSRNIGLVQLYEAGNPAIQFDARKMHWLGSPQQEVGTGIFSTKKGLRTHRRSQDPRGHRLLDRRATRRPRSIRACSTRSTALKIKVIEGYPGSPEVADRVRARRGRGLRVRRHRRTDAGAHGGADRERRGQGLRADGHEAHGALSRTSRPRWTSCRTRTTSACSRSCSPTR